MVHEVFLDADVPGEDVRDEAIGERGSRRWRERREQQALHLEERGAPHHGRVCQQKEAETERALKAKARSANKAAFIS